MSDTGAYTDTIFGIFHLLGYQFSPRLADIGGTRFWRVDGKADYGALDELASQRINVETVQNLGVNKNGPIFSAGEEMAAAAGAASTRSSDKFVHPHILDGLMRTRRPVR